MSEVIKISYPEPCIAIIAMEDKEHQNTFSGQFITGLQDAFCSVEANPDVKVIITHGYGNYYASGGTLSELTELGKGEKSFADLNFFKLPLLCKLPTIAAVQGHAIGGGLAFACLHDFMFLAKGASYGANFMKYGFTPGMGSTYTIPERFGTNCGYQLLFSARQYTTKQLEALNCLLPFYQKEDVLEQALQLARDISDKTLTSIKLLKEQLSDKMRTALPGVIAKEVAMHAKTITTQEAHQRIKENFGQ